MTLLAGLFEMRGCWHIGLRWAIVALCATCFYIRVAVLVPHTCIIVQPQSGRKIAASNHKQKIFYTPPIRTQKIFYTPLMAGTIRTQKIFYILLMAGTIQTQKIFYTHFLELLFASTLTDVYQVSFGHLKNNGWLLMSSYHIVGGPYCPHYYTSSFVYLPLAAILQ